MDLGLWETEPRARRHLADHGISLQVSLCQLQCSKDETKSSFALEVGEHHFHVVSTSLQAATDSLASTVQMQQTFSQVCRFF